MPICHFLFSLKKYYFFLLNNHFSTFQIHYAKRALQVNLASTKIYFTFFECKVSKKILFGGNHDMVETFLSICKKPYFFFKKNFVFVFLNFDLFVNLRLIQYISIHPYLFFFFNVLRMVWKHLLKFHSFIGKL